MKDSSSLRTGATWVVAWRIVGIVATLAGNILAARLLKPAEFGTYLLVTTMIALGGLIGTAGLNEAGLRFVSESLAFGRVALAQAYLRRVLKTVAVASVCASIAVALGMAVFLTLSGRSHDPLLLASLTALGVISLAWQQIAAESLRGYGDLRKASLFSGGQTGGPISNILLLVGLAVAALSLIKMEATLAISLTVASIAITFPLALLCVWRTSHADRPFINAERPVLSAEQSRELLAVGSILLLNQLLAYASQQFDIWIGGAFLVPEDLGLYGAAKRSLLLAAMPVQMATMTVVASIPRLQAQERTGELERILRNAATCAAIPAVGALVLLALFPGPILRFAFGGSYVGAAPTVLVLIVGYLVLILLGNPSPVLTMTGRHRTVVLVNVCAALALVIIGTLGAIYYGTVGLAAGSATSLVLQNGMLWWIARRQMGVRTQVFLPHQWTFLRRRSPPITMESGCIPNVMPEV